MKLLKKIFLAIIMLFTAVTTSCTYTKGITTIAARLGGDAEGNKFSESALRFPVGQLCEGLVTINLNSNKQRIKVATVIITFENSAELIAIDESIEKEVAIQKDSVNISEDKRTLTYKMEFSKETEKIVGKMQFTFQGNEEGKSKITVKVYDHNEKPVISANATQTYTFI